MSILRVARLGHPVLRQVAAPVPPEAIPSPELQRLVDDMLETVEEYDGAGLAAPQVHASVRVVVLTLDPEDGMQVWINPVLTPLTDQQLVTWEGCLSVPGLRGAVARPAEVHVRALDRQGQPFELHLRGFPAVVAQHECDHLDGVVYVDRADPRSLSFLEEYRRHGPWPWTDEVDGEDEDGDEGGEE
ncbi:peptide deformylase [Myxococcota bacterium]|nr:peptide deformylase [Myxococcota bacterium]